MAQAAKTPEIKVTQAARTPASKVTTPVIKKGLFRNAPWLKLFEWLAWISLGMVAAIILSLSLLPWFEFANHLLSRNSDLAVIRLLAGLPFIGGIFQAAIGNPIKFVGGALFVFFNINQIILLLATSNQVVMSSSKAQRIAALSLIGYVFEGIVATMSHPIYQGGMSAFLDDLIKLRIDPYYVNYGESVVVAALLFAFEIFVWMGIVLIFAIRQAQKSKRAV